MGIRDMISDAKQKFHAQKEKNMQQEVERLKIEKQRYDQQRAIYEANVEARRERDQSKQEYSELKQEYREGKFSFLEKIKAEGGKFDGSKIMNFDTSKIQSKGPDVHNTTSNSFKPLGSFKNEKPTLFDVDQERTDIFGKPPKRY